MNLSHRTLRRGITWAASGTLALGLVAGSASSPATASGRAPTPMPAREAGRARDG